MGNEILTLEDFPHLQKSFLSDLEKGWKTINGAKVLIENGKVVYGAEGLKAHINGKDSGSGKSSSSKESVSISDMKESLVNYYVNKAANFDKNAKETNSLKRMHRFMALADSARKEATKYARGEYSDKTIKMEYEDGLETGKIKVE